jgi:hypothetical protein
MKSKETQERERIVAQSKQDSERRYKEWKRIEAIILLEQMRLAELRKLGLLDYPRNDDGTEPILVYFDEAEKLLRRE